MPSRRYNDGGRLLTQTASRSRAAVPAAASLLVGGLEFRGHPLEGVRDFGAQRARCGDDADGDQGRDEAVFDCGGARLVFHETSNNVLHDNSPKLLASAT